MVVIEEDFLFVARSRYLNQNVSLVMNILGFFNKLHANTFVDQ